MRVKNSTTLPRVLSAICNVAIAFGTPHAHTARGAYLALRKFDELQDLSNQQLQACVRHIIGKKYIRIERGGSIFLSEKGISVSGRAAIRALKPHVPRVWDKKWRLVLFDIPEHRKVSRDKFASHLKLMGFITLQKSAFVFPHPCFEEIEALGDYHNIREHLTLILAESIDRERELKKLFSIGT